MAIHFDDNPNESGNERARRGFVALNPAFYVSLTTLFITGLMAGRMLLVAFSSLPDSAGRTPIELLAAQGGFWALIVPPAAVFILWVASGFLQRTWLQVVVSLAACVSSASIVGVLYMSVFLAGMRH